MVIVPKGKKKAKVKAPEQKGAEEKDPDGCLVCERAKVSEEYCQYHDVAYQNIMKNFDDWKEEYGELSFEEYLAKLIENPAVGVWAKDVAEKLLENEKSKKK